jgi:hypothetical protein
VNDGMNAPRFSRIELKVQSMARRKANHQLLRVPWGRFRRAYDEYPRWQALALWSEAVIGRKGEVPSSVLSTLKKHCPEFVGPQLKESQPSARHLLEWVHTKRFGYAKKQCWLDALVFYGVRHPLSRGAWTYWEHCEKEWNRNRPASAPSFEQWWRSAQKWNLSNDTNSLVVARAVQEYLGWETLTLWLRPLFRTNISLPPHVMAELRSRYPEISRGNRVTARKDAGADSELRRRILSWGEEKFLSQARQEGWLDVLFEAVGSHPWHARVHAYGAYWVKEWFRSSLLRYPSFRQWEQAAANYIRSGAGPHPGSRHSPRPSLDIF